MSYLIDNNLFNNIYRKAAIMRVHWFALLLSCAVALMNSPDICAQNAPLKPSREEALSLFEKGDYEKAYADFSQLLLNYSRDPLYKYYAGACLVRLERSPDTAAGLLQEAVSGSLDIRNIPDDAWYYLARAEQMAGRFPDAISNYGIFLNKTGKKAAKDYSVQQLIKECNEGKGRIRDQAGSTAGSSVKTGSEPTTAERMATAEPVNTMPAVKPATQSRKLPAEYDMQLDQALGYQVKADSLDALAKAYRKEYDRLTPAMKASAKSKITETEAQAARYRKLADEKSLNASPALSVLKDSAKTGKPLPVKVNQQQEAYRRPSEQPSATVTPVQELKQDQTAGSGEVSAFEIITDPVKIRDQVIKIDAAMPAGLIYRIQMGVFSKPVQSTFFKGVTPVAGFTLTQSGSIRYFAGMFRTSSDAGKALLKLKQLGFRDSFITAVLDGKPVSIERAAFLEKEWGAKPLEIRAAVTPSKVEPGPLTLIFRVEVTRSAKPLKQEAGEIYRRVVGNHGLDILQAPDGSTVYLTGKFITFESAAEYASLLNRNGYRDARVVAYIGDKEIPVETAKKLFNESQ
ncbi:MAG: hypothetical protein WCE64_07345 [Bacteroidales bacterium]